MDVTMRPVQAPRRALLSALPLLLLMPGFALGMEYFPTGLGVLVACGVFPFLALWAAIIYFETLNPLLALARTWKLIRWAPAMGLGLLAGALNLLFFMFLESPIWEMCVQLFSWLVPPAPGAVAAYFTIATSCAAAVFLYLFFLITILSGGLQYFSFREVGDALGLREQLNQVGQTRKIRGLARE